MAVSSSDIKGFADNITAVDEVSARIAVGRYYYSAFHSIKELFPNIPSYSNMGSHESMIHYLAEEAHRVEKLPQNLLKKLSYKLNSMKVRRVNADYKINDDFQISLARSMRNEVESFFVVYSEVENHLASRKTPTLRISH